jgi:hypothetical protein
MKLGLVFVFGKEFSEQGYCLCVLFVQEKLRGGGKIGRRRGLLCGGYRARGNAARKESCKEKHFRHAEQFYAEHHRRLFHGIRLGMAPLFDHRIDISLNRYLGGEASV